MPTKTIIDLSGDQPSVVTRAMTAAEIAAAISPAPSRAQQADGVSLSRAGFFGRLAQAAALQPGEPAIVDWAKAQLAQSALSAAQKGLFLERIDTAVSFPRIDPEMGDVMTSLGAVFGLSSEQVDDLFLGDPVAIDRADCPLQTVPTTAGVIAALEARLAALEGAA